MVLDLTFKKSLFLVLLRPAETLLMLWLYENALSFSFLTEITNAVGLGED